MKIFQEINEWSDYQQIKRFFNKNYAQKEFSSTPLSYSQVVINDSAYELPRFNNNNVAIKINSKNYVEKLNKLFSYNTVLYPEIKLVFEEISNNTENNKRIDVQLSMLKFLSFIEMVHLELPTLEEFHINTFLFNKEFSKTFNTNEFNVSNKKDLFGYFYKFSQGLNTLSLKENFKIDIYSIIEKIIEKDKNHTFAHLFNTNSLYNLGFPIYTDNKHIYQFKQTTLDKISTYNDIVFEDAKITPSLFNMNNGSSKKILKNEFFYNNKSPYLNTLFSLCLSHPSEKIKFKNSNVTPLELESSPEYSLPAMLNDLIEDKKFSQHLNKIFQDFDSSDKQTYFLSMQACCLYFPYIKKCFEETLFIKYKQFQPIYFDDIASKVPSLNKYYYLKETQFGSEHIELDLKKYPKTCKALFLGYNRITIGEQKKLSYQLYEMIEADNLFKNFLLDNEQKPYNLEELPNKVQSAYDDFMTNIFPIIRENYLNNKLENNEDKKITRKLKI